MRHYRLETRLGAGVRTQTYQERIENEICSARLSHALRLSEKPKRRTIWGIVAGALILTPWLTMYAGAEFVLHLLRIPHWH